MIDWDRLTWTCSQKVDTCPGGAILGVGCPQPDCEYAKNNLGTCDGCDGQLFISDDCSEGFYCDSNIPDPYLYEGCHQKCAGNQVLVPNIAQKSWQCMEKEEFIIPFQCPGTFHFECPANDVGSNFGPDDCECDQQVFMNNDCSESFYCSEKNVNGGFTIKCDPDQVVVFDFKYFNWVCAPNNGQCPGLGGFKVGCGAGNEVEPPQLECDFDDNPFGECRCERQLFINDDCSESFYCSAFNDENKDGCHLKCEEGTAVKLDLLTKEWRCVEKTDDYVCTGGFSTGCEGDAWEVECACAGEVHLSADCQTGFICSEANDGKGNQGTIAQCEEEGHIIDMDLHDPTNYKCSHDVEKCPGTPFSFGCKGGNLPGPGGNSAVQQSASSILVTSLVAVVAKFISH